MGRITNAVTSPGVKIFAEVRKTIEDRDMLEGINRVLIAFSGGPDSVCLLDVLDRLYRSRVKFILGYVNHGLRPQAVLKREEELTRAYARQYGAGPGAALSSLDRNDEKRGLPADRSRSQPGRYRGDFSVEFNAGQRG
jgi:tRNA(Ile)-lysidine synthase TilS/MesJ